MKWFLYVLRAIVYLPFSLLYPAKVINRKNMPKDKIIAVSNHLSALDIVLETAYLPGFRYTLAKKELSKNKFVGKFLTWLGAIYVDRGKADLAATKKVLSVLKNGVGLAIFPEGTRNKENGELMPIKEGAAMFAIKSKTNIVPVIIHEKARIFHKNYIYVGNRFDLSEYYGRRLDSDCLKAASEKISMHMKQTQNELNDYIYYNKNKQGKKLKKNAAKAKKNVERFLGI